MTLTAFKEIHKNDSAGQLLQLLTDEVFLIKFDQTNKTTAQLVYHNQKLFEYYSNKLKYHSDRFNWIVDQLRMRMTAPEDVLKGLKHCSNYKDISDCNGCPYKDGDYARCGCENKLMQDTLKLFCEVTGNEHEQ